MITIVLVLGALITEAAAQATRLTPAELELGAAMVCAEAIGGTPADRRQVAAVLRNRTRSCGQSLAQVALAPRQFATPCPSRMVTPQHTEDFILGWLGLGLPSWWASDVASFQTPRSARATRWDRRYGWRRVDDGEGVHTFWAGALGGRCK